MDFFRNQRHAHRQTLVFLGLFVLIVTLVVVLTSTLVWLGCAIVSPENQFSYTGYTALVVALTILGACIVRSIELRSGGGAVVARHLGGEPLPAYRLNNIDLQRFRNIAEEMSIASRTPMPTLYWLPSENAINAFVAGFTPADAVLAVTRGALERLNRDELQAVIAHEFSHLLNGDMRLNTQVSSWLFGIYAVYTYGRSILNTSPLATHRKDPAFRPAVWPLVFVFGGALTAIGYIGKLSGRLLQAAISRQREYLADASAVQFTRQKLGLAGALKKIYFDASPLRTPQCDSYNHFFLSEAVRTSRLFASHPPLVERIRALDASFNPDDDSRTALGANLDVDALRQALPLYFTAGSGASCSGRETAFTMRDGLALLFANLLDTNDEAARRRQLENIDADWGNDIAYQTRILEPDVHTQEIYLRLTRLRLMLVQLHTLSNVQQKTLRRTLRSLIAADDSISLLEIVIAHLVDQYLHDMANPGRVRVSGALHLDECSTEIALLQSIVKNHETQVPAQVVLDSIARNGKTTTTNVHTVRQAIDHLNRLTLDDKKNLFQALYDACDTPSQTQQEILSLLAACLHAPPLEAMVRYPGSDLTLV
ncbi:MAG: M48 family metalloprotease [Burkholderiales bacterium]|jgi:Zn-dependent protease with chaperone function|nr:M48 family metalloprotease [Burkholderiales bacterium]